MEPWIWTIIFVLLGLVLAILELFLPSGGVLAFFSFAAFCTSLIFAFHQSLEFGIGFTGLLMVGLPILVWQLFVLWPHTPIGKRMLLDPGDDPALAPDEEKDERQQLIGKTGKAESRMMPSGTVLLENRRYDAVSEAEPIDPGTPIIVVRANKLNILVRALPKDPAEILAIQKTFEPQTASPEAPEEETGTVLDPFDEKKPS